MSDDSYMYVFRLPNGKFGIVNRSASCDYDNDPGESNLVHDTIQGAMDDASDQGLHCEYGVSVSPNLRIKTTYEVIDGNH
jgi:hypothetical protein